MAILLKIHRIKYIYVEKLIIACQETVSKISDFKNHCFINENPYYYDYNTISNYQQTKRAKKSNVSLE